MSPRAPTPATRPKGVARRARVRALSPKRKARTTAVEAAVPVPDPPPPESVERLRPGRALAAAVLGVLALAGAVRTVRVKIAQHWSLPLLAPLLPQGMVPGTLSRVVAIKPDRSVGILTLSQNGDGPQAVWRVQRFGPGLDLRACADFPWAGIGRLADLAPLPDGGLWLAGADGRLWRLDPQLRPVRAAWGLKTGRDAFDTLDRLPDGRLLALDGGSASRVLDAATVPELAGVRCASALPDGGLACLIPRDGQDWVEEWGPDETLRRSFPLAGLSDSSALRLAVCGQVLALNDFGGVRGVVFYGLDGKPLGDVVTVGSYVILNPGFVAADALPNVAYIHFGDGLIKVQLPGVRS